MKKREEEPLSGNLVAMIDVVFQLIIFFVCTVSLQDSAVDARIRLAMAPHGKSVEVKNPLEIVIAINEKGGIFIGRNPISPELLRSILRKTMADSQQAIPIIISGDGRTKHEDIRRVMDICTSVGLYKIKFAAYKEKG